MRFHNLPYMIICTKTLPFADSNKIILNINFYQSYYTIWDFKAIKARQSTISIKSYIIKSLPNILNMIFILTI